MTGPTDRWRRVEALYHDVLARPVDERAAALVAACAGDAALQAEVQSLLDQPESAAGFLASPALDLVARHGVPAHSSLTGRRLGVFELQGLLGVGGMGEVYRARDTRLQRDVAIKILPRAFQDDPDRLARFEREARVLASLNHPHIGAIYGLEEADPSALSASSGQAGSGQAASAGSAIKALVMELVEGENLSQRIARGKIPVAETLRIARQIASALDAAHDHGIVHRDLKPDNVRITPDGHVKVLDFGLAKMATAGGSLDPSNGSTMMATTPGLILGTAAYMSPEQASGRSADRASDMWAFGCVLFEMLTGRRAFEGATTSEILANVLKTEPDWDRLPAETPDGLRRLLRRSLQKDQKLRFRDMRDAGLELDDVRGAASEHIHVTGVRSGRRERIAWASALALAVLIAGLLGARALRPAPSSPEVRLEINTPPTRNTSIAMSPDGLTIVFVAPSEGRSQLWLRALDSPLARPLAGTEGALLPFWSPDSRSIGFFAGTTLKRMDIDGGSVKTLMSVAPRPLGGAWSTDGTIVFSASLGRSLLRVSAEGGEPSAATRFESLQHRSHSFPQFLPDGRHFLFFVSGSPEARGVYVGQLDGLDATRVFDADAPAVYAATGHLLFIREGKLLAQDFDPDRLEVRGDAFPTAEHVTEGTTLSASVAGPIVYRTPSTDSGQRQLVWVDRSGREIEKVVYPDTATQGPSLSHDGRRVAVFRNTNGNTDIWSYETGRRAWD